MEHNRTDITGKSETNTETDMEMDIVMKTEMEEDKETETERGQVEKGWQRGMSLG